MRTRLHDLARSIPEVHSSSAPPSTLTPHTRLVAAPTPRYRPLASRRHTQSARHVHAFTKIPPLVHASPHSHVIVTHDRTSHKPRPLTHHELFSFFLETRPRRQRCVRRLPFCRPEGWCHALWKLLTRHDASAGMQGLDGEGSLEPSGPIGRDSRVAERGCSPVPARRVARRREHLGWNW